MSKIMITNHKYEIWYRMKGHTYVKQMVGNRELLDPIVTDSKMMILKIQDAQDCVCFACVNERNGKELRITEERRARFAQPVVAVPPRPHNRKKNGELDDEE